MRLKTFLGLAFVGVFGFLVLSSFGSQVSGYESFAEAAASGRNAHVVGTWVRDAPSAYDPAANRFTFVMTDDDGAAQRVVYAAPKPASFEDAEKVVVEGRMEADHFAAERILVKCPSKYNDGREFVPSDEVDAAEAAGTVSASAEVPGR